MNERRVYLVKTYELISGGKLNKNGKSEINWFALKEEFINEERGNRRDTTKRDLKKRLIKSIHKRDKKLENILEKMFEKRKKMGSQIEWGYLLKSAYDW